MNLIGDDIDLLEFAGLQESQYMEPTVTFVDEVKERFEHGIEQFGESLPWSKTQDKIRIRPGEVSLWAGVNGHGKSLVLGQVLLFMPHTQKILVASLEMKPAATLERMVRQAVGAPKPTNEFIDRFMRQTDNMFIYDQIDTVEPNRILGLVHYAAQEFGINQIMIDSLVKCGIPPDDYAKQKEFVDRLCWAAKTHNIHIHLVHHMRKGNKETDKPDKFDIKGAGEITDLVDNVLIVHRNKKKEGKIEAGTSDPEKLYLEPDETIAVSKQRHGEWEGSINLYFHKPSTRFISGPDSRIREW